MTLEGEIVVAGVEVPGMDVKSISSGVHEVVGPRVQKVD